MVPIFIFLLIYLDFLFLEFYLNTINFLFVLIPEKVLFLMCSHPDLVKTGDCIDFGGLVIHISCCSECKCTVFEEEKSVAGEIAASTVNSPQNYVAVNPAASFNGSKKPISKAS